MTRGIVTKITKISTPENYPLYGISFKKFSRRHSMLFNKYAVSVKRHIREGICIPQDVKPDLVRNITTRNRGCGQCA